ncbi:hypothetical protein ACFO1B_38740 [Dactylosporangium siamense]|uniref:Uncharacterized protein n=1 Tax=Dactylosporangium siamense TaxID=685454 RepID=A0A919UH66_9ACTN|nr:hypothetical protein [Dactylosporangium siamense]GIG50383.1 hypothetical protein Dsi01nite_084240 [Dactylosporangium siamense]
MGDWFQTIADLDATAAEAPHLADGLVAWLVAEGIVSAERTDCVLSADEGHPPGPRCTEAFDGADHGLPSLATNGLHAWSGRTVVHPIQGSGEVGCPHCDKDEPLGAAFFEAINAWYAQRPSDTACRHCGRTIAINDWHWPDAAWAFADLGLTFWNWPPLRDDFIAGIGRRLGHRVRLVAGKL